MKRMMIATKTKIVEEVDARLRHLASVNAELQMQSELLRKEIRMHKKDKEDLERAVKRRTRQLEQKNTELEIANKDLTSLTYISSHDLQEPLRKVKNYISVLLEEEKSRLSTTGRGYLKRMYDTTEQMRMLIEDLLKYSLTKRSELVFENTDLNLLMSQVKSNMERMLQQKKATIITGDLCSVPVVPFQLKQVFENLISNSLKFSKPNQKCRITVTSVTRSGSKRSKIFPKKKYCHITFTDNGIGFDPKYNKRIFEVFQRLHTADKYPGTGIGLAICKRIIENHQGLITATGIVDQGARFDIYIPL